MGGIERLNSDLEGGVLWYVGSPESTKFQRLQDNWRRTDSNALLMAVESEAFPENRINGMMKPIHVSAAKVLQAGRMLVNLDSFPEILTSQMHKNSLRLFGTFLSLETIERCVESRLLGPGLPVTFLATDVMQGFCGNHPLDGEYMTKRPEDSKLELVDYLGERFVLPFEANARVGVGVTALHIHLRRVGGEVVVDHGSMQSSQLNTYFMFGGITKEQIEAYVDEYPGLARRVSGLAWENFEKNITHVDGGWPEFWDHIFGGPPELLDLALRRRCCTLAAPRQSRSFAHELFGVVENVFDGGREVVNRVKQLGIEIRKVYNLRPADLKA